ncbi:DUF4189 domain-containing protein [Acinetobacter courvalinii]|uniref:DUF4189 domain-containing protein n=1 Tax=Acinetobacter courvalinii TaxID=280147 RepID=UPI0021D27178|nr:DUF4189 domain-containing protein [Acinetobacter courvalinii]MCU4638996.1 DUF4189 domain-containing protein [Acinetobacter courvalinii]
MGEFLRRLIVLSVIFLGVSSSIYACPAGMVELPGGVCLPPDHQNSPLNNLPSASPPPPVWATRWGAIATDGPTASLGAVVDMRSKRQAEKAALTECRAKGGKKCEVDLAYYNQCAVMVTGDNSYLSQGAVSKEEATRIAMQKCQAKDVNCRVYYSGCSMPVRVN